MGAGVLGYRGFHNGSSATACRLLVEASLCGGWGRTENDWKGLQGQAADLRGFGWIGADLWSIPGLRSSRTVLERFPQIAQNARPQLTDGATHVLAAGKEGPVSTVRYEMLLEGLQEAEARIHIEMALLDPARRAKLGQALSERCQALLDERIQAYRRTIGMAREDTGREGAAGIVEFGRSGWEKRSEELYRAAADVARAIGK